MRWDFKESKVKKVILCLWFSSLFLVVIADKDLTARVKKEIDCQIQAKLRNHAKECVYDPVLQLDKKADVYLYKVPKWPVQARYFLKKDSISVDISADFATQAYSSSGATQDMSNLVFQQCPIRLKDILLASKLIDIGAAEPTTSKYQFLKLLKDQILAFDASTNSQELAFSYVRHFLKGDISLGMQVPIVRREHDLEFTSCLSPRLNEQLASESPGFFTTYPDGLKDLLTEILCKKDLCFGKSDSEAGLGDVTLFCNYEIRSKTFERCFVGIRALLPTSRRLDIYKLWDPELGNGGFTEFSLFGSLLYHQSRFFNPHIFGQLTYACPATTFRRVPKRVSSDDITSVSSAQIKFGEDFMLYGNGVKYVSTQPYFSELDATVRGFSDGAKKTKIDRGGNVFFRVGNMFERIFSERFFFDIFYDFYGKWKDYLGFKRRDCSFDASLLTRNSYEVIHRIGGNLSWQADDAWYLHLGGLCTIAGSNTPRLFEINGAVSYQF
jgi:hypothetical protein